MSPREKRLRERIDVLTDERNWYKARIPKPRPKGHPAWCVYCGARTKSYSYPTTCKAHHGLASLDPFYDEWALT